MKREIVATSLTAGTTYEFKVEARNQLGYSAYSTTIQLLCAYIAEVPTNVVTEVAATQIKVSWQLPSENGTPITEYKVFVKEIASGEYTHESTDCVGADATVISTTSCYIDIVTLEGTPWGLDGGDHVWAKVSAVNVYGESAQSTEGNGAYYTRIPDPPINLQEDISVRTSTTDGLTWEDGANTGGVVIQDYRIN